MFQQHKRTLLCRTLLSVVSDTIKCTVELESWKTITVKESVLAWTDIQIEMMFFSKYVHFKRHFEQCFLSCVFEKKTLRNANTIDVHFKRHFDRRQKHKSNRWFLISSWVWGRVVITWTCFCDLAALAYTTIQFEENVQSTSSCKHYKSARMHVRCRYCARSKRVG